MTQKRESAMRWWNGLSNSQKTEICKAETMLISYPRRWETLTGSEIERIYQREVNLAILNTIDPIDF